jgi:hypothetical protein
MKKLLFAILVLLGTAASSSAMADWVRVHGNDKLNAYADTSSVRKKGNITKISSLFDFKVENSLSDGSVYLSIIRETEFNCKHNQQRMVAYSIHSARMGKGKVLESGEEPQEWKRVSRDAIALGMKNFACSRD